MIPRLVVALTGDHVTSLLWETSQVHHLILDLLIAFTFIVLLMWSTTLWRAAYPIVIMGAMVLTGIVLLFIVNLEMGGAIDAWSDYTSLSKHSIAMALIVIIMKRRKHRSLYEDNSSLRAAPNVRTLER